MLRLLIHAVIIGSALCEDGPITGGSFTTSITGALKLPVDSALPTTKVRHHFHTTCRTPKPEVPHIPKAHVEWR